MLSCRGSTGSPSSPQTRPQAAGQQAESSQSCGQVMDLCVTLLLPPSLSFCCSESFRAAPFPARGAFGIQQLPLLLPHPTTSPPSSLQPLSRNPGPGGRATTHGHNASGGESSGGEMALCPICSGGCSERWARGMGQQWGLSPMLWHVPFPPSIPTGSFSTALLPAHASRCGEEDSDAEVELLSSASSPVPCPICGLCFTAAEVERHCSTCGE